MTERQLGAAVEDDGEATNITAMKAGQRQAVGHFQKRTDFGHNPGLFSSQNFRAVQQGWWLSYIIQIDISRVTWFEQSLRSQFQNGGKHSGELGPIDGCDGDGYTDSKTHQRRLQWKGRKQIYLAE